MNYVNYIYGKVGCCLSRVMQLGTIDDKQENDVAAREARLDAFGTFHHMVVRRSVLSDTGV